MKKWECTVCGYIHEGDSPPDTCPVCGAGPEYFKEVAGQPAAEPAAAADTASAGMTGPGTTAEPVSAIARLVAKLHLHPISVHTPNGVLPLALVLLLIAYLIESAAVFEQAAFFNLVFVLLSMPVVLATGYIQWKNRYKGVMTKIFGTKIVASVIVCTTLLAMIVWRLVDPQVLTSPGRWIYLLLCLTMVGAAGLAGHMGGKLVFKD
ncbi:rubredoxin-like domain-containing protein [Desulfofustis limnaeus]|jgi:uncharacterized membrane protein|uniref:Rubredoxin-like domain-containing protein n=1 Tax=Desulfofustis limnaeus TaxID=2740163 RepID=A0ABN6M486_9BACT|nr:DUF2231 domain-containing protein [Desulfofustis limnaeus]MDX9894992.1 rubredoxin-type Fe(Cys)4 protein [Desulfofustis sp.]BDD86571.1 hypothetical protein DPPLL_09360 [Desulfofustis limnaeus]